MRQDVELYGIKFEDVVDLIPGEREVLVNSPSSRMMIKSVRLRTDQFRSFEFKLLKWKKNRPLIEDRVFMYECLDDDGLYSFDREMKLREGRTSRVEKIKDEMDMKEIRELAKERGVL